MARYLVSMGCDVNAGDVHGVSDAASAEIREFLLANGYRGNGASGAFLKRQWRGGVPMRHPAIIAAVAVTLAATAHGASLLDSVLEESPRPAPAAEGSPLTSSPSPC
ncbi:MAG: hypothetical protein IKH04_01215 [Kiritimatiellae bacterium]|nr:hypothetical protein [Kiritimatiellia bacterium]